MVKPGSFARAQRVAKILEQSVHRLLRSHATIGSTRAARRAAKQLAARPRRIARQRPRNVAASVAVDAVQEPGDDACERHAQREAIITPTTASRNPSPTNCRSTSRWPAPSATRIPILTGSLRDRVRHHAVQPQGSEQQRQCPEHTQEREAPRTLSSRFTSDCSSVSMRKIGSVGSSSCTAAMRAPPSGRGSPAVFATRAMSERSGALPLRQIQESCAGFGQLVVLAVLRDADHLRYVRATVHPEPAAERVLIRPQATASVSLTITTSALRLPSLAANPSPHQRDAESGEILGRDRAETHGHAAGVGIHALE